MMKLVFWWKPCCSAVVHNQDPQPMIARFLARTAFPSSSFSPASVEPWI